MDEQGGSQYFDGDLLVDFRTMRVWLRGDEVFPSALQFRILTCLINNEGRPISTRTILHEAWSEETYDQTLVRWHIARLRWVLDDRPPKRIIHARGYGYRYDRQVEETDNA